jgi:hypothetical protein
VGGRPAGLAVAVASCLNHLSSNLVDVSSDLAGRW